MLYRRLRSAIVTTEESTGGVETQSPGDLNNNDIADDYMSNVVKSVSIGSRTYGSVSPRDSRRQTQNADPMMFSSSLMQGPTNLERDKEKRALAARAPSLGP